MKKGDKVKLINDAIARSSTAITKQANAHILSDGRIEYTMLAPNGRYTIKATFKEILGTLWGDDIRNILKQVKEQGCA